MRGALLFVTGLFAGLAVHVSTAQNTNSGVVMLNHVGINVPNIAAATNASATKAILASTPIRIWAASSWPS